MSSYALAKCDARTGTVLAFREPEPLLACHGLFADSRVLVNRTSAQKPGDELLANFRKQFPEVAVTTTAPVPPTQGAIVDPAAVVPLVPGAQETSHSLSHEAFRDQDPTPRASNEPWRFTPSLLDPNSFSFTNFANAPPGYYTPTPGGTNTIYHPQAGDLHTPTLGLGMGLGTPLSMPTSEGAMHSGPAMMDLAGYQGMHPQQFQQHFNPFAPAPAPQQSFAPSTFVHQDTGYETMEQDGSPMNSDPSEDRMASIDGTFHNSPMVGFQARQFSGMPMAAALPPSAEKFRFHSTLNAPTAMIKHADEIPVTYLNKGQAYSLSIVDTNATMPVAPGTKFRTFVRISFEDEQQRQKPGVCWALWKEGRGTNEAHQRGGKLQAVEYVEAGQPTEGDDKRTRVELESASFDGFSVIWTPGINGAPECNIAVRFNFLSTDFSHSKGVKGIPVRLCAKTSTFPSDPTQPAADANPEICFCKVKLFRDHGAERKLSNDVAHVKKTIDKLKQQIAQAESGMKDFGKRKRSSAASQVKSADQRPGKVQKHKRTWSMSSTSSAGGGVRPPLEEDLHFKLQTLQDMFTSTRPVSVLYLRGEDLDDPDLHPVSLPGEQGDIATKVEGRDGPAWQARSGRSSVAGSSLVSPSPSSLSLASQASAVPNRQWSAFEGEGSGEPSSRQGSDQPSKITKTDDAGNLSGWIEALGVDTSYRPPSERVAKPVACFYVLRPNPADPEKREYHRAIYLAQRNLKDFNYRVAAKWNLDPSKVLRTVHVLDRGLEVEVDDDVISEMREGQDMVLEIKEIHDDSVQPKREWDMVVDPREGDAMDPSLQCGYEFRLTF
ncbi:Grainyhead-like protein 2-like protein [Colletotrichum chlorophyti]|uniref:Grainyhead-like protein 2-like protein n=1 Tax=Colletotrichum chlorophyti TaxID=708187 RepID=A0A1Q8S0U9_9PEZI|nr:Grainyhead-like protein 2-like protein [Colletotrichum chlorophyti]